MYGKKGQNLKVFIPFAPSYLIKEKKTPLTCSFRSLLDGLRLDRGGSGGLILLKEPVHTTINTLLQGPERLVAQCSLGLVDVVVAGHAAHDDGLSGESGCLSENAGNHLADIAKGDTELTVEVPVGLSSLVVTSGMPDGTGKVPEVNRSVICDEEGLAVDALVIEGNGGRSSGGQEELRGEEMGVGDVADVSEVEEVLVSSNLDCVLATLVGVEDTCEGLDIALAEDASWTDGGCEELGVVLAVGLENDFLSLSL